MTAQIPDALQFDGHSWVMIDWDGRGLLSARSFGLEASPSSTADYAGFLSDYEIAEVGGLDGQHLMLRSMRVHLGDVPRSHPLFMPSREAIKRGANGKIEYPSSSTIELRSVDPTFYPDISRRCTVSRAGTTDVVVTGLALPVAFTGGLLVGKEHLPDRGISLLASPQPVSYRDVLEIGIEAARVVGIHDRSAANAECRAMSAPMMLSADDLERHREAYQRWLASSFTHRFSTLERPRHLPDGPTFELVIEPEDAIDGRLIAFNNGYHCFCIGDPASVSAGRSVIKVMDEDRMRKPRRVSNEVALEAAGGESIRLAAREQGGELILQQVP